MLRQYELVEKVLEYDPQADEAMLNRAYVYTVQKHGSQKRASGDPYFSHPVEVAGLMTDLKLDQATIITALLHDTVEDSDKDPDPITHERLLAEFGELVAGVVAEATDDKSLPKEVRKALQVRLAPKKTDAAKMLKLADKISNLRAIAASPPAGWDHARRLEYIGWAGRVAAGLRGVNPALDALFEVTYREAVARLAQEA